MEEQKWQTNAIFETKKEPLWDSSGRATVLEAIIQHHKGMVIRAKQLANKKINGWQCTIIWHIDDLKTSHVYKVVEDIITQLKFGNESPLTTSWVNY